jgi:peptide/nickel transport system ATP-binding protein
MKNSMSLIVDSLSVSTSNTSLIHNLTFTAEPGSITALIGPSGSGKTTIINAIGGLTDQNLDVSGSIQLGDYVQSVATNVIGRAHVPVIFQAPLNSLNPVLSTGRFLEEIARAHNPSSTKNHRKEIVHSILNDVGLAKEKTILLPGQMSGGERQKILIAGALLTHPKLILADEPTASLDVISKQEILSLLKNISKTRKIPILLSTHDMRTITKYANRIIALSTGRIDKNYSLGTILSPLNSVPIKKKIQSDTILKIKNVNKYFGGNIMLESVSFELDTKARLGLAGRSGCGKTTLARCISGLLPTDSGSIEVRSNVGTFCNKNSPGPDIQMIFQEPYASFDPQRSLAQSLMDAIFFSKKGSTQGNIKLALQALSDVGLCTDIALRKPSEVSAGECQRAAIARAILTEPKVLIADEPTSSLDYKAEANILELLLHSQELYGFAMILISHDLILLKNFCSEIAVMQTGKIIEYGPTSELMMHPKCAYTAELITARAS